MTEPDVIIGTIVAPFGIKGEVKIRVDTDFPERYDDLKEVWLHPKSGDGWNGVIKSLRHQQGAVLIKFAGCDTRSQAEELRGVELRIDRSELMELEGDEFYVHDLIGIDVYTVDGEHVGEITEVLYGTANDVYVTPRGMIPAVKQFVKEVDIANRKMIIDPIEGMLD